MRKASRFSLLFTVLILGLALAGTAQQKPTLKWTFEAESNLYAAPLVADVNPHPGLEIFISDSEARTLRCIGSDGTEIWNFRPAWTKRQTSAPAISLKTNQRKPTLAVVNSDGLLYAIDAANGTELWHKKLGGMEWCIPVWVDLNGDNYDELLVLSENGGLLALDASGTPLWTRDNTPDGEPIRVESPFTVADTDSDNIPEILAVASGGLLCLDSSGTVRWTYQPSHTIIGAPALLVDPKTKKTSVVCLSQKENTIHLVDEATGKPSRIAPLLGKPDVYSGSSIVIGDIIWEEDVKNEIVFGDAVGHVYCFDENLNLLWVFSVKQPVNMCCSSGDVDDDGVPEILVGSGDHNLYALSDTGELVWSMETGLRIVHPPTLADIDDDGYTDILFGSCDRIVRCLGTQATWRNETTPLPMRRSNSAQTGFRTLSDTEGPFIKEDLPLIRGDAFSPAEKQRNTDTGAGTVQGWIIEKPQNIRLDTRTRDDGSHELTVQATNGDGILSMPPLPVPRNVVTIRASLKREGTTGTAELVFWGQNGLLTTVALVDAETTILDKPQETHLQITVPKPWRTRAVSVRLTTPEGMTTVWANLSLNATARSPRKLDVLVNQVGYDVGAPKRFVVQTNINHPAGEFEIVADNGSVVYSGSLSAPTRIIGAYDSDWGYFYRTGDFASFDQTGTYIIRARIGTLEAVSPRFQIAPSLLWEQTCRPAYRFFYYQRCGTAIPDFHGACHLDDAVSPDRTVQHELTGGWHDAGDYNKYHNAPYVLGLAQAYQCAQDAFAKDDGDSNGRPDLWDEVLWGIEHVRKMIAPDGSVYGPITSGYGFWGPPERETDNLAGTGDERPIAGPEKGHDPAQHAAALASAARAKNTPKEELLPLLEKCFAWRTQQHKEDFYQLGVATTLYELTGNAEYAQAAKTLVSEHAQKWLTETPSASLEWVYLVNYLKRFDEIFQQDHTDWILVALETVADALVRKANNPFGIYTFGTEKNPNYFNTPEKGVNWHVGTNSDLLNAATTVALAFKYIPKPEYERFVYDQLNWVLGMNPLGICMMEGVGKRHLPTYHNRILFGNVPRGAVPGGVVNGVTYVAAADDRPYLDLSGVDIPAFEPNEFWLPHNTAYVNLMSQLINMKKEEK